MRELLARSVFRVGIKLQCERCAQRNWYALDDLSETVRCERCLQSYAFPASSPHDAKWEYRPIGRSPPRTTHKAHMPPFSRSTSSWATT